MKKHHLIPLLIPILALASCAPTTPVVAHMQHVHKHTSAEMMNPKTMKPAPIITRAANPSFRLTPSPFISTHGIPGKPC